MAPSAAATTVRASGRMASTSSLQSCMSPPRALAGRPWRHPRPTPRREPAPRLRSPSRDGRESMVGDEVTPEELHSNDPRTAAIARLKAKRNLRYQAAVFAVISVVLIVIWLATDRGFFWPIFPIAGFLLALGG